MALAGALCVLVHAVTGFTNKSLRGLVAAHLGRDYSTNQMSYDLRRLRLHGLIVRLPRSNTYVATPEGIRVAVFYTKLQRKLLLPLLNADPHPAPLELRRALSQIERSVADYIENTRIGERRETCHTVKRPQPQEGLSTRQAGVTRPGSRAWMPAVPGPITAWSRMVRTMAA